MVCLAEDQNKVHSLKEISKKEKISFDYLEKIACKLKKAGLIKSKKGSQGGYFLGRLPRKIKIGEIIRILEGEAGLVECTGKQGSCPLKKSCSAKKFWIKLQNSLNSALDSLTLADLI